LLLVVLGALALAGCPTVDLGDQPADVGTCNPAKGLDYFTTDIWPKYLTSTNNTRNCVRTDCHGNARSPSFDPTMPIDYTKNYRVAQGFLNCGTPTASPLLTKPLAGIDAHGGGDIFPDMSDPAVVDFLAWFQ